MDTEWDVDQSIKKIQSVLVIDWNYFQSKLVNDWKRKFFQKNLGVSLGPIATTGLFLTYAHYKALIPCCWKNFYSKFGQTNFAKKNVFLRCAHFFRRSSNCSNSASSQYNWILGKFYSGKYSLHRHAVRRRLDIC